MVDRGFVVLLLITMGGLWIGVGFIIDELRAIRRELGKRTHKH